MIDKIMSGIVYFFLSNIIMFAFIALGMWIEKMIPVFKNTKISNKHVMLLVGMSVLAYVGLVCALMGLFAA